MTWLGALLLALGAFVLGVALERRARRRLPRVPSFVCPRCRGTTSCEACALEARAEASPPAAAPPPVPRPAPGLTLALAGSPVLGPPDLLGECRGLARQVLAGETPPSEARVEQLAHDLADVLGSGWARGATDLGRALIATSGLPAEMVDAMVQHALEAMQRARTSP